MRLRWLPHGSVWLAACDKVQPASSARLAATSDMRVCDGVHAVTRDVRGSRVPILAEEIVLFCNKINGFCIFALPGMLRNG